MSVSKKNKKLNFRTCPKCGSNDIKFNRERFDIYCNECGFLMKKLFRAKNPNYNWNPHPGQNDWNR